MTVAVQTDATKKWLDEFAVSLRSGAQREVNATARGAAEHAARHPHLFTPRTGRLQSAMTWQPATGSSLTARTVDDTSRAPYAPCLYFGSRPHVIEPRRAKMLRFVSGGNVVFARRVNHPGNSARPFFDDASRWGALNLGMQLDGLIARLVGRGA